MKTQSLAEQYKQFMKRQNIDGMDAQRKADVRFFAADYADYAVFTCKAGTSYSKIQPKQGDKPLRKETGKRSQFTASMFEKQGKEDKSAVSAYRVM